MDGKIVFPRVVGLTNYRQRFTRPMYGVVAQGQRSRQAMLRDRQPARRGVPVSQFLPDYRHAGVREYIGARTYTRTKTRKKQYKSKKVCCTYIKGKKVCKPKYCLKKRRSYRRKFYCW